MSTGSYDLAGVRVDADLAEQRLHAEGARLVGHDRHDQLADLLVAQQLRQQPHEHHRRRRLAALGAGVELLEQLWRDGRQRLDCGSCAARHVAAERLPPLLHVLHLGAVVGRAVERRLADVGVRNRDAEARAERPQLLFVHLLLLVRDVLAFARLAEPVALDRPREDDGRRALVSPSPPCRRCRP